MGLVFLYLILALAVSFLCSVLEAVLLSAPMSFISMKESSGARGAALLKKLKQDIDRPISAILSLNTIAHTVGAAGVGAEAVKVFGDEYFGVISAVLTILILVLSEIIPKTVGARYWRSLALWSAPVINALIYITYPCVLLSKYITRLVATGEHQQSVSREEVSAMATVGAEEGVLKVQENKMIQNMLKLSNVKAEEIMTPSVVVACAKADTTLRDFYKDEECRPYSRIPVYDDDDNYITGYVLRQTILEKLAEDRFDMRLADIVRPVLSFSENESVSVIWEKLLEQKEHVSVIIDAYGCFRGIVTLEDIIETVFGLEIVDENDPVPDMQKLALDKWRDRKLKSKAKV